MFYVRMYALKLHKNCDGCEEASVMVLELKLN